MRADKISVIIPCFNSERTIERAINSVLEQSISVFEIIVVDNGSTDTTKEKINTFGDKIIVLDCQQEGAGPARNFGINFSSGQLIAFLDSDDYWYPKKLEKQLLLIPEIQEAEFLIGTYADYFVGSKRVGHSLTSDNDQEAIERFTNDGELPALLSSWLFPKRIFEKHGGFDPMFLIAQDFELLMRYAKTKVKIYLVREPLLGYSISNSSESFENYLVQFLTAKFIVLKKGTHSGKGNLFTYIVKNSQIHSRFRRQASSGLFIRKGLVAVSENQKFIGSFFLAVAFTLAPVLFAKKISRQRLEYM